MEIYDEIISNLTKKGYNFKHSDKLFDEKIIIFNDCKNQKYCVSVKKLD